MPLVEVLLAIEFDSARCAPEVRAWIDLRPAVDLRSEFALPLVHCGAQAWRGAFAIGDSEPGYFLYRFGLAAHEGAHWTLNIRHRAHGRVSSVLVDGDSFAIPKQWLVGTCVVPCRDPQLKTEAEQAAPYQNRASVSGHADRAADIVPFRPLV